MCGYGRNEANIIYLLMDIRRVRWKFDCKKWFFFDIFFQWLHVCQHNKALMFFKGVSSKTFQKYLAITCKLIFADLPKRH